MNQLPHQIVTTHADCTRQAQQRRYVIGRRGLMKLAAGAGVATMSVAGRGLILPWVDFGRAATAAELVEPEVRASRDGLLDTTLTCTVQSVPLAGRTAIMNVYEGSAPAPTLRIRPGDRFRINLVNALDDLPPGLPKTSPFLCPPMIMGGVEEGKMCDTNLHVHGLHVSPSDNSDNIFLRVPAGESFQYEYQISSDQPAGLYWYHPHLHHRATDQVFGGLAGAIIVVLSR